jgi:phage/plasmid-associated DNA primase
VARTKIGQTATTGTTGKDGNKDGNGKKRIKAVLKMTKEIRVEDILTCLPSTYYNPIEDAFYTYVSLLGCYEQVTETDIGHSIQEILTDASVTAIKACITRIKWKQVYKQRFYLPTRFAQPDNPKSDILINVFNGVVVVHWAVKGKMEIRLEPHSEKWKFGGVLPVDYDPKAECPLYLQLLTEMLPDAEDQKLIEWFAAYGFCPDNRFNVCLFALGDTHTGRSTLIYHGYGAVFGSFASHLKLEEMESKSGGVTSAVLLKKSLINVGTEIIGRLFKTALLKQLISGEIWVGRDLFEKQQESISISKLWFLMNEPPKMSGTKADIARIRIGKFKVSHEDNPNHDYLGKIKAEANGIFYHLLGKLLLLMQEKEFPRGGVDSQAAERLLYNTIDPYTHFQTEVLTKGEKLDPKAPWPIEWKIASGHDPITNRLEVLDLAIISFIKRHDYGFRDEFGNVLVLAFKRELFRLKGWKTERGRMPGNPNKYKSYLEGFQIKEEWRET